MPQSKDDLVERLDTHSRNGVGAASDWSDAECSDYWCAIAMRGRRLAKEAAEALSHSPGNDEMIAAVMANATVKDGAIFFDVSGARKALATLHKGDGAP